MLFFNWDFPFDDSRVAILPGSGPISKPKDHADDNCLALGHDGSRLTHGHIRSQVCCAVYVLLVRHLLTVKDRYAAWDAAVSSADQIYAREARFGKPYQDELRRIVEFSNCEGSGYVIDCLCSAWDAVHDAEDYVDAVCRAVRFGNDT
ncbi:MAG: ADP-ribosylglycohydrolase family protein, partial [Planctomycetota bacterium]|nr:ADP-ribosylglycohydrolase family protein [Planctomycetota bacterium]